MAFHGPKKDIEGGGEKEAGSRHAPKSAAEKEKAGQIHSKAGSLHRAWHLFGFELSLTFMWSCLTESVSCKSSCHLSRASLTSTIVYRQSLLPRIHRFLWVSVIGFLKKGVSIKMRLASMALTLMASVQLMLEGYAIRRRHQRDFGNDFNNLIDDVLPIPDEPLAHSSSPDYFKDYLSRGMFQCTSQYVETITKLHEFIKKAHDEYKRCERRKGLTPKSEQNPFESLNNFVDQWQREEEEGKSVKLEEQQNRPQSAKTTNLF